MFARAFLQVNGVANPKREKFGWIFLKVENDIGPDLRADVLSS
jgi:hypothetical protein